MPGKKKQRIELVGVEKWTVEFLDERVEAEFDEFTADIKAEFVRISEMIAEVGLQDVSYPHVAHVNGKIWEMRARDKNGWGRLLYCTVKGRKVIILRAFSKKTNKTPQKEIETATERMKSISK